MNTLPWWIVLLLAGGFATAAWWVGEMIFKKTETSNVSEPVSPASPANQDESMTEDTEAGSREQKSDKDGHKGKSPVIYRRESF